MFRLAFVFTALLALVAGHGRLLQPPARSTAWRYGFDTPVYYNDNELFCGGFTNQWVVNGGKCGICGDPWQGPRDHEAGGKYAGEVIVANYLQGQTIDILVHLTTNHLGWIEFKLCPHNDFKTPAKLECFQKHVLPLADGSGTRLPIYVGMEIVELKVNLPKDVTCEQCILQWQYHTGNTWGVDPDTGENCRGCSPEQEEFYGCADVRITKAKTVELTNYRTAPRDATPAEDDAIPSDVTGDRAVEPVKIVSDQTDSGSRGEVRADPITSFKEASQQANDVV